MATMERTGSTAIERSERAIAGSSSMEVIGGAAAIVLPILGLVGVFPHILTPIAFIAVGAAMMIYGGALSSQRRALLAGSASHIQGGELIGGMSAELLGGAAVSALGIISLAGNAQLALIGVCAIVAGAVLAIGAGATARLSTFQYGTAQLDEGRRAIMRESVEAAAGTDLLVGLASIVLGILLLAGVGDIATRWTLGLVAALALGGALFLNGTTVGTRMVRLLQHHTPTDA